MIGKVWMPASVRLKRARCPRAAVPRRRIPTSMSRLRRAAALIVRGRVLYETMEEFWPRAREDASLPDYLREYGEIWTAKPKVLVSRTRRSADHNTRIIGGDDAIEQLAA